MTLSSIRLHGLGHWRLKSKLLLAFSGMAVLSGVSGGTGLIFLKHISASVAVFSDVTSPLMSQSTALVDDAQRMTGAYLAAATNRQGDAEVAELIRSMKADSLQRLNVMHILGHDRLPPTTDKALSEQVELLSQTIFSTLALKRDQDRASALLDQKLADIYGVLKDFDTVIGRMGTNAEGRMTESEDLAKVDVQTGQATVLSLGQRFSEAMTETFPTLQGIYKITRESIRLRDAAKSVPSQMDVDGLAAQERQIAGSFKIVSSALGKLRGRLRTSQDQSELSTLGSDLVKLHGALLGSDGVLDTKRSGLILTSELSNGRERLDAIEQEYYRHINQVDEAIHKMNDKARDEAARSVNVATSIIGSLGALAVLISALAGIRISKRLTKPLEHLSERAAQVQAEGGAHLSRDEVMANRSDEFGTLSRSFDAMLLELYEARQHLIVTSQAELQTQYERLESALSNMSQGLCMFDAEGRLIVSNRRYAEIYGHTPAELVPGTPLQTLLNHRVSTGCLPEQAQHFVESRAAVLRDGQPWAHMDELPDGRVIAVTARPMPGGGAVVTHEDVTERRKAEAEIAYLAYHDSLTGLPNRRHFNEGLQAALKRQDGVGSVAVLCLDLDHFKAVNDTLGHPVGDALLQAVAERIRSCLEPSDIVARLGGDEFAIIQVESTQPIGATDLADKLINVISKPYDLRGHYIQAGTSVGIAIAQSVDVDPNNLLKNADMALYRAKTDGRGTYRFFEAAMDAQMQQRRVLELDLRSAVIAQEFELYYQPLVDLQSNSVSGFEALLRWNHPQKGIIPPSDFIPMLEELGLIGQVGAWVLKQACTEAAAWPDRIKIAVNLSVVQFKRRAVVLDVAAALMASGLRPSRLELEVTESVMLQDTAETMATLNELHGLGVQISMDDFGTGYSSLSYLRSFPFDKIKIDRSFIRDMSDKPDSIAIIRAVTGLSLSLGMTTTAEGIETLKQLDQLRAEGCTQGQGYFLGRPKPAGEIKSTIENIESMLDNLAA